MRHLGGHVKSRSATAPRSKQPPPGWACRPDERARTAIYASGRALRGEVNACGADRPQGQRRARRRKRSSSTRSSRVNATREELRYARTYAPGMVVEVDRRQRVPGLVAAATAWSAPTLRASASTWKTSAVAASVPARANCGREARIDPLRLFEVKPLEIHAGDRIRWTATDHQRGLLNADQARIIGDRATASVRLRPPPGLSTRLSRGDPMLRRLDLAYALNAHMAQGLTSDRGIAVMDSRERKLSNQQTFLVTITRLRDGLTLYVDNAAKLEAAVERNPGMKRSALETVDLLGAAAAKGQSQAAQVNPRDAPERERSIAKPFEIGI